MANPPHCTARVDGGKECGGKHLHELHGCGPYISMSLRLRTGAMQAAIQESQSKEAAVEDRCQPPSLAANCNFLRHPALLALQKIEAETTNRTQQLTTLMDEGSQITLLREGAAVDLGLGPGTP